jgi:hypothetical protein
MDQVEQALAEFDARGTASVLSKIDALLDIEQLSHPRVLTFLLQVASSSNEQPEVRAHVIRVLRSRHYTPVERVSVAHATGTVLAGRSSPGLRALAALTLAEFTDVEGVIHMLGVVALDESEPLDLRYSAFTSLERAGHQAECVEILRQLSADETLGRSAGGLLATWNLA